MRPIFCRIAILGLLAPAAVAAFSSGPPDGMTDAPGEFNCTSCHSSFPLNSGDGNLALATEGFYSPGDTLDVAVDLADPGQQRWGFELTVLDGADQPAGSILVTDAATQLSNGGNGRQYLKHTAAGTYAGTPDASPGWTFQWVAPAGGGTGDVTFYVAGNAADGTFDTTNDYIYTHSVSVFEAETSVPSAASREASWSTVKRLFR